MASAQERISSGSVHTLSTIRISSLTRLYPHRGSVLASVRPAGDRRGRSRGRHTSPRRPDSSRAGQYRRARRLRGRADPGRPAALGRPAVRASCADSLPGVGCSPADRRDPQDPPGPSGRLPPGGHGGPGRRGLHGRPASPSRLGHRSSPSRPGRLSSPSRPGRPSSPVCRGSRSRRGRLEDHDRHGRLEDRGRHECLEDRERPGDR